MAYSCPGAYQLPKTQIRCGQMNGKGGMISSEFVINSRMDGSLLALCSSSPKKTT